MSTWWGNDYDNYHRGPQTTQYGLGGDDTLISTDTNRSYRLYGDDGDDELVGYNVDDELYGGSGADNLYGYGGWDYPEGGSGNDSLGGFYGNDNLVRAARARTGSFSRPSSTARRISTRSSIRFRLQ